MATELSELDSLRKENEELTQFNNDILFVLKKIKKHNTLTSHDAEMVRQLLEKDKRRNK